MTSENLKLGKFGEDFAVEFLKNNGYRILKRNFRTNLGEIDIVTQHHDTICFIEVKARNTILQGTPWDAISRFKKRKLIQVALCYLKFHNLIDVKARFDVVAVTKNNQGKYQIEIIKNAFLVDDTIFF